MHLTQFNLKAIILKSAGVECKNYYVIFTNSGCENGFYLYLKDINGIRKKCEIKMDDIVLVIFPDTFRGHWPLGRITGVFEGKDGRVRVVKVKIGEKEFIRLITRLCLLEFDN